MGVCVWNYLCRGFFKSRNQKRYLTIGKKREREREEGEKGQAENPNPAHLDNISKPRFICAVNQQTRTHSTKETGERNTGSKRKREREGET